MKNERLLFMPVETKVRELDAKILLSCYAAQAGYSVVLGMQSEVLRLVKYLPRGVYLEKGMSSLKREGTGLLTDLGNKIVAWCEEGLVIVNPEAYARDRVDAKVFSQFEAFYAWGKVQADSIRIKMDDQAEKIVLAGNPRFDLLREPYQAVFEDEAKKLRDEHGRFILINTNFGLYNSFYGPAFFVEKMMRANKRIQDEAHEQYLNNYLEHVKKVFNKFVDLLPVLCKAFPDHKVILRPHPSENHDNWKDLTSDLDQVEVIHKGNVIPWILASDVLIHNSCTTGVEGHVLGKPVVAYRPVHSDIYEFELPKVVSIPAFTASEVVEKVGPLIGGDMDEAPNAAVGVNYAANITGPFSCRIIMDSLNDIFEKTEFQSRFSPRSLSAKLRWIVKDIKYDAKVTINRIINRKQEDVRYMEQKIPGIELEEVNRTIESFRKASGAFSGVKAQQVKGTRFCFTIEAK